MRHLLCAAAILLAGCGPTDTDESTGCVCAPGHHPDPTATGCQCVADTYDLADGAGGE